MSNSEENKIISGYQENEITISIAFNIISRQKKPIMISVFIVMIITLIYGFSLPNIYRSNGIYEVVGSGSTSSHIQKSGLTSIAGAVGVSLGGGQTNRGDVIVETVRSKTFLKHLLQFDGILPGLVAAKYYNPQSETIGFDPSMYLVEDNTWNGAPPTIHDAYKKYSRQLSIFQDQGDNFIYISFDHVSPNFSQEFVLLVIEQLNLKLRSKSLDESNAALNFLEDQLGNTFLIELRSSISSLIQKQLEKKMLADVSDNFALSPIETPFIEQEKESPSRLLLLIWATISSLVIFSMIVFFWEANKSTASAGSFKKIS
jgi:uncharacterized protein involved in exopolysaccharide biosynthesis